VFAPTTLVVIVKLTDVACAGTVTLAGTVAAAVFELESVTTAPAGGALPVRVTVPAVVRPPVTLAGVIVTVEFAAAVTIRFAVFVTDASVVEIVTVLLAATPRVVIVKVTLAEPAGTVTLAGTVAAAVLLLETVTETPPAGATPLSVSVPVALFPPTTDAVDVYAYSTGAAVTVIAAVFVTPA